MPKTLTLWYRFVLFCSLGAKFRSPILGLIYNNEMDDFSSPGMVNEFGLKPAPVNFIQPGKRPQSSSAPVIIVDEKGDVDVVLGASGGTVITTAVVQVRGFTFVNTIRASKRLRRSSSGKSCYHLATSLLTVTDLL
jgi:gamma-glutamyltranspeptidase